VVSDLHLVGEYSPTPGTIDAGVRICTNVSALTEFVDVIAAKPVNGSQVELTIQTPKQIFS
jgi:hypothetical protein